MSDPIHAQESVSTTLGRNYLMSKREEGNVQLPKTKETCKLKSDFFNGNIEMKLHTHANV